MSNRNVVKTAKNSLYGNNDDDRIFSGILNVILIILVLLNVLLLCFEPVMVSGSSMENTVFSDDIAIITPFSQKVESGDIIVIKKSEKSDIYLIKRAVATEGEQISFLKQGDFVYLYKKVDGKFVKMQEDYIKETMKYSSHTFPAIFPVANSVYELEKKSITLDKNQLFILGDNRNNSSDSRYYGVFDISLVKGKVIKFLDKNSLGYKMVSFFYGAKKSTNN